MTGSAEIVRRARAAGVVIPAFNVPYLSMVAPIVQAVSDLDAFAFIETARPEWIKGAAGGPAAVMAEFRRWEDPDHVRLHLDHVPVIDEDHCRVDFLPILREAIALGYHSVMLDGSRLELDENIAATRQAAEAAHAAGIPCEAELGAVLGHEAGPLPPYEVLYETGMGFTRVEDAARFTAESGCDWLSVAFGNIHGGLEAGLADQKKVAARLNLELLDRLYAAAGVPLVLHGGSGIQREYVLQAIRRGIAKINIGTENRQAYDAGLRKAGRVADAQQAVYEHTAWLVGEVYGLKGSRRIVV